MLYVCETWSLTLREESRQRVFENRSWGEYLGPRGMRMGSGEDSTMRNFIVPNIIRLIKSIRLRWTGHLARMEKGRRAFKTLTGTPAGKKPL